jgi:hypothetical protein
MLRSQVNPVDNTQIHEGTHPKRSGVDEITAAPVGRTAPAWSMVVAAVVEVARVLVGASRAWTVVAVGAP